MTRYAVYFAPAPDSELHRFGSAWLGRDAWAGAAADPAPLPLPLDESLSAERIATITRAPRLYGFHATLKPPFALAAGRTVHELEAALEAFGRGSGAFEMPPLQLAEIGGFLALVPSASCEKLTQLAERAVRAFEPFRAAPSSDEQARRAHASLDSRERELLAAWGYPYVLDRWRFHLTLTERLAPSERERVAAVLAPGVAAFCRAPVRVDAVALFVQPEREMPFAYQSRYDFGTRQPASRAVQP